MSKRTDRLREENNQREQQLQDQENQAVLTDMVVYIRSANISPYEQELVRRDIGAMLLEGEQRGEKAQDIIGEDYRAFCDRVIGEIPKVRGGEYVLSLVRDVLLAADVLVIIWLAFQFMEQVIHRSGSLSFAVTDGNLVCGVLCLAGACLLFYAISKNAFRTGGAQGKQGDFGLWILVFLLLVACMGANIVLKHTLVEVHLLVVLAGIALIFGLYKLLDAKLD